MPGQGGGHGAGGAGEGGAHRVPHRLEHPPAVGLHGAPEEGVVPAHRVAVGRRGASRRAVLPSWSVNRNVTGPVGRSAGSVMSAPAASGGAPRGAVNRAMGRGRDRPAGGVQGER